MSHPWLSCFLWTAAETRTCESLAAHPARTHAVIFHEKSIKFNGKSWIFTISHGFLGNLGADPDNPPGICAILHDTEAETRTCESLAALRAHSRGGWPWRRETLASARKRASLAVDTRAFARTWSRRALALTCISPNVKKTNEISIRAKSCIFMVFPTSQPRLVNLPKPSLGRFDRRTALDSEDVKVLAL